MSYYRHIRNDIICRVWEGTTMNVWVTNKDERVCNSCKHFHPHYRKSSNGMFYQINAGHCAYPRMKSKEAYDSCKYFEKRE